MKLTKYIPEKVINIPTHIIWLIVSFKKTKPPKIVKTGKRYSDKATVEGDTNFKHQYHILKPIIVHGITQNVRAPHSL